jgi:hypothetical protein
MENSFGGCNKAVDLVDLVDLMDLVDLVDQALADQEVAVYDELVVVDHATSSHRNKEDQEDQEDQEKEEEVVSC